MAIAKSAAMAISFPIAAARLTSAGPAADSVVRDVELRRSELPMTSVKSATAGTSWSGQHVELPL